MSGNEEGIKLTPEDEARLERLDSIFARMLMARGPGLWSYLESLPDEGRAVALSVLIRWGGMPVEIAAMILISPAIFGQEVAADPEMSHMFQTMTMVARASLTPEEVLEAGNELTGLMAKAMPEEDTSELTGLLGQLKTKIEQEH